MSGEHSASAPPVNTQLTTLSEIIRQAVRRALFKWLPPSYCPTTPAVALPSDRNTVENRLEQVAQMFMAATTSMPRTE